MSDLWLSGKLATRWQMILAIGWGLVPCCLLYQSFHQGSVVAFAVSFATFGAALCLNAVAGVSTGKTLGAPNISLYTLRSVNPTQFWVSITVQAIVGLAFIVLGIAKCKSGLVSDALPNFRWSGRVVNKVPVVTLQRAVQLGH